RHSFPTRRSSDLDSVRQSALKYGAIAALEKPISSAAIRTVLAKAASMSAAKTRKLLVIEDDAAQRIAIRELVGDETVEVVEAPSAAEGLATLRNQDVSC